MTEADRRLRNDGTDRRSLEAGEAVETVRAGLSDPGSRRKQAGHRSRRAVALGEEDEFLIALQPVPQSRNLQRGAGGHDHQRRRQLALTGIPSVGVIAVQPPIGVHAGQRSAARDRDEFGGPEGPAQLTHPAAHRLVETVVRLDLHDEVGLVQPGDVSKDGCGPLQRLEGGRVEFRCLGFEGGELLRIDPARREVPQLLGDLLGHSLTATPGRTQLALDLVGRRPDGRKECVPRRSRRV